MSKPRRTRPLLARGGPKATPRKIEEGCLFGSRVGKHVWDDGTTEAMAAENPARHGREDGRLNGSSRPGHDAHIGLAFWSPETKLRNQDLMAPGGRDRIGEGDGS